VKGRILHTATNFVRRMSVEVADTGRVRASRSAYLAGVRAILPLSPAVVLFGASFGVLARSAGFDPVASIVMSATTFAGSAQFAVVSVLGAGGTALAAIAAAVLLNARYGPMGLAAAKSFRGGPIRRLFEAQLLVDESWALSQDDGRFDLRRMLGAGLVLYAGWVGGTALGVAAGSSIGDPATLGLDAAFPALFLALLVPLVRSRRALAATLAGGGIALLLTPVTPAGLPVIAATSGVLFGLLPERSEGGERWTESERSEAGGRERRERRPAPRPEEARP
jgi:4-azaleucine resistance transporter AzlC